MRLKAEERRKEELKGMGNSAEIPDNERTNRKNISKKQIITAVVYYFYPKIKDVQKSLLIVIGFLTGIFFKNGNFRMSGKDVFHLIMAWFIIEFLIYQARYLWNDIRGVRKDVREKKEDRIPVKVLGRKAAINIAMVILFLRVFIAVIVTAFLSEDIRIQLILPTLAIIISSILYEVMRTKECVKGIFLMVGFGYMIRFAAGGLAAWPEIMNGGIVITNGSMLLINNIPCISLLLLLTAYIFMGGFSAVLSWTHEAVCQIKDGCEIQKKHYQYLYDSVKNRTGEGEDYKPLNEKGCLLDLWNIEFIISIVLLSIANMILNSSNTVLTAEAVTILFSILISITSYKKVCCVLGLLIGDILLKAVMAFLCGNPFSIYICCTQLGFTLLYFVLRFLFSPDFNALVLCVGIVRAVYILIISKDTWDYMREKESIETHK